MGRKTRGFERIVDNAGNKYDVRFDGTTATVSINGTDVFSYTSSGVSALVPVNEAATTAIVAGTTRTQAGATALTAGLNRIDTSTAPAAGSLLGDGVRLPVSAAGENVTIINNTSNPIQVYGAGTDTINGVATGTGIAQPPNSVDIYKCPAAGVWNVDAGVGFSGQLNTVLALDGISAAGANQGAATNLTADFNRVTTATALQGVRLPASAPGLDIYIINHSGNSITVYGGGTDLINDVATGTGVVQMANSVVLYTCYAAGNWYSEGLATGFANGFQTQSFADALTAVGTTQAGALQLTATNNRITAGAGTTGVNLPAAVAGMAITVTNDVANSIHIYAVQGGTDTLNGVAAGTGLILAANSTTTFLCTTTGAWETVGGGLPAGLFVTAANTTGFTATGAQVAGADKVILQLTGALGAGANIQLPTVAAMLAATPAAAARTGSSFYLRILNLSSGAFAWTVTTNTGWTLNGTMTIAQNFYREFLVTVTSASAATASLQSLGTAAQSAI